MIAYGSKVRMHYTIALEDGMVADTTEGEEPLEFVMGAGDLEEGLELALIGLQPGDRQTVKLTPDQAFGYPSPAAIHDVPRRDFPPEMDLRPGLIVSFVTPGGDELPGTVKEVSDETVKVDFNHPLAGHEITYSVEILDVGTSMLP
ncbi:FKBP-type peptidyl-prolyl cis-trans isomerase [Thioalkalivibrio thiocyanodenitrificans]|uniref:FKBP-type peptidyl-prolyl cis-trans isomerase n=1 Tax=Thioalkalivibrio thiocyanodenitrificans TaxID=243063 RepID=UPI00036BB867|nr:peptidylprolyl isomerase [Thioalkalivibrio thiocyanodenitrificans]